MYILSIFQEVEIINNVQDLLKKTIDQSEKQIRCVLSYMYFTVMKQIYFMCLLKMIQIELYRLVLDSDYFI